MRIATTFSAMSTSRFALLLAAFLMLAGELVFSTLTLSAPETPSNAGANCSDQDLPYVTRLQSKVKNLEIAYKSAVTEAADSRTRAVDAQIAAAEAQNQFQSAESFLSMLKSASQTLTARLDAAKKANSPSAQISALETNLKALPSLYEANQTATKARADADRLKSQANALSHTADELDAKEKSLKNDLAQTQRELSGAMDCLAKEAKGNPDTNKPIATTGGAPAKPFSWAVKCSSDDIFSGIDREGATRDYNNAVAAQAAAEAALQAALDKNAKLDASIKLAKAQLKADQAKEEDLKKKISDSRREKDNSNNRSFFVWMVPPSQPEQIDFDLRAATSAVNHDNSAVWDLEGQQAAADDGVTVARAALEVAKANAAAAERWNDMVGQCPPPKKAPPPAPASPTSPSDTKKCPSGSGLSGAVNNVACQDNAAP